jgi:hypothetical protein
MYFLNHDNRSFDLISELKFSDITFYCIFLVYIHRLIHKTKFKQEFLGRTNRLLSLIRHRTHWKRHVQNFFYCCVCIRYRGNVSTEPLPINDRGIFPQNFLFSVTLNLRCILKSFSSSQSSGNHTAHAQNSWRSVVPIINFRHAILPVLECTTPAWVRETSHCTRPQVLATRKVPAPGFTHSKQDATDYALFFLCVKV